MNLVPLWLDWAFFSDRSYAVRDCKVPGTYENTDFRFL